MKEFSQKIIVVLLLVLTLTSCSQNRVGSTAKERCIEAFEQKKISTVVDVPARGSIPFIRIKNVTIVDNAIDEKIAKDITISTKKDIVVSTKDSFSKLLESIAKHNAAITALATIREFYENQVDINNDAIKDSNVSK